uniref:serine--tRNA ligase n=1 Tax=Tetraselmis sp. GSL018 TaxID=582737 RepID=A0A061RM96_9CHLO
MLDINLFREEKGGNPEIIRESQRRRYADVSLVDKVIDLDKQWRAARFELDAMKKEFNALNKEIATKRKAKEDATELQEKSKAIKAGIAAQEEKEAALAEQRDRAIIPIGNLVHDSVPVSDDEANNAVVKTFGTCAAKEDKPFNHVDLVQLLDIVNLEQVAGGRGYYLMGAGALLNQALISAASAFLFKRGFTPVQTPFFMRQSIMGECAQLSQFDEELYKVTGEGEDKYLIATSEQTLCAMHRKQWFEESQLPIRYCGYSTCFRKEAGSHGRDTLGIFRVHQFEKVEQFVVCSPKDDESWKMMDEMLSNAEEFYQALGIPYQVVNIVSGELNNAAAKKYDLEAWFPASQTFRELVSCSNCTDYQSRRLEIRLRSKSGPKDDANQKEHVHLLNSTLTATERTLCCILENYQTPDGVEVPEILQPFMCGLKFLPFKKMFDSKKRLVDRPGPAPSGSDMSTA